MIHRFEPAKRGLPRAKPPPILTTALGGYGWSHRPPAPAVAGKKNYAPSFRRRATQETRDRRIVRLPCFRTILVPLDGSPFAEHALPPALVIARQTGAQVRVMHVLAPLDLASDPYKFPLHLGQYYRRQREQKQYLDRVVNQIAQTADLRATPVLAEGSDVAEAILAQTTSADLIVMASHQRGLLGRWLRGGVAASLLRRSPAPLLLTPGLLTPGAKQAPDATASWSLRRILMPLDGSPQAEQAWEPATALGDVAGAEYALLRVINSPDDVVSAPGDARLAQTVRLNQHAQAQVYLRQLVAAWRTDARRVQGRIAYERRGVADAIVEQARLWEADLIALTVGGRGNLLDRIRQRVADRVVRRAPMPVLVVPAAGSRQD